MSRVLKNNDVYNIKHKMVLNSLELFFLRLHAHGFNMCQIGEFLELDSITVNEVQKEITDKYATSDWTKIVCQAFENKHLKKIDYLENTVKDLSFAYTRTIFENFIENNKVTKPKVLKEELLGFYQSCESNLKNQYENIIDGSKLNTEELELLKLKYNKASEEDISQMLSNSEFDQEELRNSIFLKLSVSNWFSVFKKALQFGLLNKTEVYLSTIEAEITDSSNNIIKIISLKSLSVNEKKLSVYEELLKLYSNIEFSNLIYNFQDQ